MPLSENEQRILQDIERNFYESDPAFAEAVGSASPYRHARRNTKLAIVGFVGALVTLLLTFQVLVLGLLAFLAMVACAFVVVTNVRRLSAVGLKEASPSERTKKVNDSLSDARKKLRRRFKSE